MRDLFVRWLRKWVKPVASRPIGTITTIEGKRRSGGGAA